MKILFKEDQKFTQWWIWLIILGLAILTFYGIYMQLILGEQFGDKPMSDLDLILFSGMVFSLIALFSIMRMKTEIDENEIRMQFIPFVKKNVKWAEIENATVVTYGYFVGWGIR